MSEHALSRPVPLRLRPGYRLQWEPVQDCHVLLYPEGMVKLNDSAAAVLGVCDGTRSAAEIVAHLQREYPEADLREDVIEFLEDAYGRGWIQEA